MKQAKQNSQPKPDVVLQSASEVEIQAVPWLWDGWLAAGKLHIFAGAPGAGKTTLAIQLAAVLTVGGAWPDGSPATQANVVIWSGEDDPADTLTPRLVAAGADLSKVFFVAGVTDDGETRAFDPATDMQALGAKIREIGDVKLVIVDPIVAAIAGDSHKNAEVRRGLQPFADLASEARCAILGITHFTKGTAGREPIERVTGSLAYGAVARIVLMAAKLQDNEKDNQFDRVFMRAKSNIGPDGDGFGYELTQIALPDHADVVASTVAWGSGIHGSARQLLADAETDVESEPRTKLDAAQDFLFEKLRGGPVPVGEVYADAKSAGHSKATLRRAKELLGVQKSKAGMDGPWSWQLPRRCSSNDEDAHPKNMSTFGEFEHLRGEPDVIEVEI